MSVLIVEDDQSTCDLMTRLLGRSGYKVRCAATLAEAYARLTPAPCCVLLDLTLPDGSGLEFLRHVRGANLTIPVAVLTGVAGERAEDAVLLKPSAMFTKPVDLAEVVSWVRAVCPGVERR
jgi:DNA-binding response OmpR family regulator